MKITDYLRARWLRLRRALRRAWDWHHEQMNSNPRYARAFVQGALRAIWERSFRRIVTTVAETLGELYLILRFGGGWGLDEDGFAA